MLENILRKPGVFFIAAGSGGAAILSIPAIPMTLRVIGYLSSASMIVYGYLFNKHVSAYETPYDPIYEHKRAVETLSYTGEHE